MHGYHYQSGDRPLEGHTIQRGVGRGAFGEVYYALSDSGREVALKCILGYEQIELRGVSQCMNLKSPHLVSIFDVRHNEAGQNFVIMEYVAGPSLRELLDDAPSGLGPQKTAFFLRELGKGLTYLHDRGIVHRDLKPANIFYEDGYVKIGDYGLSKAISPSQHSGQTITVGTVHYMAPEIGHGRYDRSIDIYALGVLVYEMLTGHVPFFGASHGEILMKHLMDAPDLSGIEEPFATVIRKAMAKDPADRYQTVQEMVEAVFGAEHIQQSVSVFRPETLSVVAERTARQLVTAGGGPGSSAELPASLGNDAPRGQADSDVWVQMGRQLDRAVERVDSARQRVWNSRDRLGERIGEGVRGALSALPVPGRSSAVTVDPMTERQRWILAAVAAVVVAIGTSTLAGETYRLPFSSVVALCAIWGAVGGLFWSHTRLLSSGHDRGWSRRVTYALPAGLASVLLSGAALVAISGFVNIHVRMGPSYVAIFGALLLMRWDKCLAEKRHERVILSQVVWAGVLGYVLAMCVGGWALFVMGTMAGVSLMAQVVSPFAGQMTSSAGRMNARRTPRDPRATREAVSPPPLPAGPTVLRNAPGVQPRVPTGPPVPVPLKLFWLLLTMIGFSVGAVGAIVAMVTPSHSEFQASLLALFLGGLGGFLSARQFSRKDMLGWWGSFVRPLLVMVLLGLIVFSVTVMCTERVMSDDETIAFACFIAVPAVLLIVLSQVSGRAFGLPAARCTPPLSLSAPSTKLRMPATLFTCFGFVGIGGLQRFYVGKFWTGMLWLFTFGLLHIGTIFDLIMICMGEFRDKQGHKLVAWNNLDELRAGPSVQPRDASPVIPVGPAEVSPGLTADLPAPEYRAPDPVAAPVTSWNDQQRSSTPRLARTPRQTSLLLSALGYGMLLPGVLVGAAAVLRFPLFIAAGFPDAELTREFANLFNFPRWPGMLQNIGIALGCLMLIGAAVLLVIARRDAGAAHASRAMLGIIGLFLAGYACYLATTPLNWINIIGQQQNLQKLSEAVESVDSSMALAAAIALFGGTIMLVWPERRDLISDEGLNAG